MQCFCDHALMQTYSVDIRQRVVERKRSGGGSESIAKILRVGKRSVELFWKRYLGTGSVTPSKRGGYKVSRSNSHEKAARAGIKENPSISIDGMVQRFKDEFALDVGRMTVWDWPDKNNLSLKKRCAPAGKIARTYV